MNATLQKAIQAYGGADRWSAARTIEAEFSVQGLAFTLKRRRPFQRARLQMDVSRPHSRIMPIGEADGVGGILEGVDVRLEDSQGNTLKQRKDARSHFFHIRQQLYWDDLDMAYFANYAMWNYLALPALLMREDIVWDELEVGLLKASFPASLPTHCRTQYFRFDRDSGLLLQHDYTAEIISRFARAAHVVLAHAEHDGMTFTSHRRVTPRGPAGKPLKWPTLIDIRVHRFQLLN